jgi:hypothetical protein
MSDPQALCLSASSAHAAAIAAASDAGILPSAAATAAPPVPGMQHKPSPSDANPHAMNKAGMEALQREWAGQVALCDDAELWPLHRIGGLDVHWIDGARGDCCKCSQPHNAFTAGGKSQHPAWCHTSISSGCRRQCWSNAACATQPATVRRHTCCIVAIFNLQKMRLVRRRCILATDMAPCAMAGCALLTAQGQLSNCSDAFASALWLFLFFLASFRLARVRCHHAVSRALITGNSRLPCPGGASVRRHRVPRGAGGGHSGGADDLLPRLPDGCALRARVPGIPGGARIPDSLAAGQGKQHSPCSSSIRRMQATQLSAYPMLGHGANHTPIASGGVVNV